MSHINPILELKNVSKTFNGIIHALDDVSMAVGEKQMASVVGENGAGKSTLMKILVGLHQPDAGELYYRGVKVPFPKGPSEAMRRGISIVYQEKGVIPHLKVWQFLLLGCENEFSKFSKLETKKMKEFGRELLDELHLTRYLEDYMYELPPSKQKLVEVVRAFLNIKLMCRDPTVTPIIILDEPTSPLEIEEREELLNYITEMKKESTFIFVSHIISEVISFSDIIYVLRDGKIVAYHDQPKEVSEEELFKEIVGRTPSDFTAKYMPYLEGKIEKEVVMSCRNVTAKGYFYDCSFDLHKGECIGFFGPIGSGKSEILKSIYGLMDFDEGTLIVKGKEIGRNEPPHAKIKKGVGYFSGDPTKELFLQWSIAKNISIINLKDIINKVLKVIPTISFSAEKLLAENVVKKLNIKVPNVGVDCYSLSGGTKQKVSIGRWLQKFPEIFMLEDPTVGIDVGTREEIYETLLEMKKNGISMILVSDDPKEYAILCDRIFFLRNGKIEKVLSNSEFRQVMEI
jgi:ABC-type sugar transport system ATPase subunit